MSNIHLVAGLKLPGKEEVCEGLHGGEECKHNPVHHPLDIPWRVHHSKSWIIFLVCGFCFLRTFFVSLFDVLGPDCLVAGIGRVEGTQAQGDDPGEQVRDHCKTSSHRGQKRLPRPFLQRSL